MHAITRCLSSSVMLRALVVIMAGAAMAWCVPSYTDVKEYFAKGQGGKFREKTEPNGFGGMTWGEQFSKRAPLQLKRKTSIEAVYVKRKEVPDVYGGSVRSIEYHFMNGLFQKAVIEFKTRGDFEKALQAMQILYGADCMTKNRGKVSKGYKNHYGVGRSTDYYGRQSSVESREEFVYDFEEAYAWKGSKTEVLLFSKCDDPRDNQKAVDGEPKTFPTMTYCLDFSAVSFTKPAAKPAAKQETSFKPGTEPAGFRAAKWGMTPAQIGKPCKIEAGFAAPFSTYTNASDYLTIGSTALNSVYYVFQAGKLVGVIAEISASDGYDYIFDLCAKKFGDKVVAEDELAPVDMVAWNGALTQVKMARLAQEQQRYYIVYACAAVAPELLQQWQKTMRPADEQQALEHDL